MEIERHSSGIYHVRFITDVGWRTLSLNTRDEVEAHKLCARAKIKELEEAAKVTRLTAAIVSSIVSGKQITMQRVLEPWVRWMTLTCAPRTKHNRLTWVTAWIERAELSKRLIHTITDEEIMAWVNQGGHRGTRAMRLQSIRCLFNWANAAGLCHVNPAANCRVRMDGATISEFEPRNRQTIPDALIRRVIDSKQTATFWRVATALGRYMGLRLADCCYLQWDNLQPDGRLLAWTHKKEARLHEPMPPEVLAVLPNIHRHHDRWCFPPQMRLHADCNRRHMLSMQFTRLLRHVAGVGEYCRYSFHDLRRTFASRLKADLLASGVSEEAAKTEVARRMAHHSRDSQDVYMIPITAEPLNGKAQ